MWMLMVDTGDAFWPGKSRHSKESDREHHMEEVPHALIFLVMELHGRIISIK